MSQEKWHRRLLWLVIGTLMSVILTTLLSHFFPNKIVIIVPTPVNNPTIQTSAPTTTGICPTIPTNSPITPENSPPISDFSTRIRLINRYASANGNCAGFPNFEEANSNGIFYGVILFTPSTFISQDVPGSQLKGTPNLSDVASTWRAINEYATSTHKYCAGFPTFEKTTPNGGQQIFYGAVLFKLGSCISQDVPGSQLKGTPNLSDVVSTWRAINEYATSTHKYCAGFPTFEQALDNHGETVYGAVLFKCGPSIDGRDVPTRSLLATNSA